MAWQCPFKKCNRKDHFGVKSESRSKMLIKQNCMTLKMLAMGIFQLLDFFNFFNCSQIMGYLRQKCNKTGGKRLGFFRLSVWKTSLILKNWHT